MALGTATPHMSSRFTKLVNLPSLAFFFQVTCRHQSWFSFQLAACAGAALSCQLPASCGALLQVASQLQAAALPWSLCLPEAPGLTCQQETFS